MALRAAMVLTTIADPVVLEGYCENFKTHGHLEQVQIILIPDRKTPRAIFDSCARLRKRGLDASCPPLQEQERILMFRTMAVSVRALVAACRQLGTV